MFKDIDRLLSGLGVTYEELYTSLDGCINIAITPSVPFPAVSASIMRSEGVDAVIRTLYQQADMEAPAEDARGVLPLNLPVFFQVACTEDQWIISSDAIIFPGLVDGLANSFSEGAIAPVLARLQEEGCQSALVYDSKGLLALAQQYVVFIADAKTRMQVSDVLSQLQKRLMAGYISASVDMERKEYVIVGRGPLGAYFGTYAGLAGFAYYQYMQFVHALDIDDPVIGIEEDFDPEDMEIILPDEDIKEMLDPEELENPEE